MLTTKQHVQSDFIEIALQDGCSLLNFLHIFKPPFREKKGGLLHSSNGLSFGHKIVVVSLGRCQPNSRVSAKKPVVT